jgi:hypothetical protein
MITRGQSATDGRLQRASTIGLQIGTNRKSMTLTLGASIFRLRLLNPHRIFFPKGTIPSTTRVKSAAAMEIILKFSERIRTKGCRSTTATMKIVQKILIAPSPRTRRAIHHGIRPRAFLLDAASGHVVRPYIRSNNSRRNNISSIGDTKPGPGASYPKPKRDDGRTWPAHVRCVHVSRTC